MTRLVTVLTSLAVGAALLSGCTAQPEPDTSESPAPTRTLALPSENDIAEYHDVSCADLITADLARTLNTGGFEAGEPQPWPADEPTFADGQICEWSDGTSEPELFGWARATPDEIEAAQTHLDGEGWSTEQGEAEAVVYLAPDADRAFIFDLNGEVHYGSTLDGAKSVTPPA
ncbi:hypothetical protein [Microbacterium sp. H1-D42]|uniref:hypothetical protein n=1 Tax=Microbacterium sp. H1-D42 TaxID=2925844 RepID=UPI001F539720|nr:hypothetical protein [Microbacterium sp. H1-D42]UNK69716.1 hypothetical protein MNR00_11095 [Microbacterium sp. H1-D42]